MEILILVVFAFGIVYAPLFVLGVVLYGLGMKILGTALVIISIIKFVRS